MAKKSDRHTAAPLPVTTFGEIATLGEARVHRIGCKHWGLIEIRAGAIDASPELGFVARGRVSTARYVEHLVNCT